MVAQVARKQKHGILIACFLYRMGWKLLQPFLVNAGVTTQEEIEELYTQMLADLLSPTFQGKCTYRSVWGRKRLV
jgi:hypothetical protein